MACIVWLVFSLSRYTGVYATKAAAMEGIELDEAEFGGDYDFVEDHPDDPPDWGVFLRVDGDYMTRKDRIYKLHIW